MQHNDDAVVPLYLHPTGLIQCGWCLQIVTAEWASAHREMHAGAFRVLSELPQFDGTGTE